MSKTISPVNPFAQRPFGAAAANAKAASASDRSGADGIFRRRGYEPLSAHSPASAAEVQARNNAVGNLVTRMRLSNSVYHSFQHNGQSALIMQKPGSENYHLAFSNGHQPSSRFQRFLHPDKPFQFSINGSTNEVVQTHGPTQLNQAQIFAALQAIDLKL